MKTKRIESRRPEVGGPSGRRISFPDYLRRQIERLTESGRLGTARNYLRTWNSLNAFLAGKPFPMHRFDSRFVEEYGEWLRRRGVVRNTVSFYMRVLRSVYNRAVGERLVAQTYPFGNVYTGIDRTRKRAVDERIIGRLSRLDLRGSAPLALARDLFVFSYCARGMAFVDMAFLRRQDIRDGVVHYVRHKTGQPLSVRLEPCMQAIVARYAGRAPGSPYVFPVLKSGEFGSAYRQYQVALNYYNRQLKRLAELALERILVEVQLVEMQKEVVALQVALRHDRLAHDGHMARLDGIVVFLQAERVHIQAAVQVRNRARTDCRVLVV